MTTETENHAEFHLVVPAHLTEESVLVQATLSGCERCAAVALASLIVENKAIYEMVGVAMSMALRRKEELAKEQVEKSGKKLVNYNLN